MKIDKTTINEFIQLYAREVGEPISRDDAEEMIRQLFALYQGLAEWHYHRTQQSPQTADAMPSTDREAPGHEVTELPPQDPSAEHDQLSLF